jgi:RNA polymerase sigma factor (sigma-70 family)
LSPLVLHSDTEKDLIAGCISGDRKAQKGLFQMYGASMYAICLRYARNKYEAEDILQEAFVRVFKYISHFNFEGSFEGWLKRIMINTSLKYNQKHKFLIDYDTTAVNSMEEYEDPEIIHELHAEELMSYIRQLPDGYRMVFNLYIIEGFSHKEIANLLQIEEVTSRSQLLKARKLLQEKINAHQKMAI